MKQVSEGRKGARPTGLCSACLLLPSLLSPSGLAWGEEGRPTARPCLPSAYYQFGSIQETQSMSWSILAFLFQFEYIKMQLSSCANPQAIEIKGF